MTKIVLIIVALIPLLSKTKESRNLLEFNASLKIHLRTFKDRLMGRKFVAGEKTTKTIRLMLT